MFKLILVYLFTFAGVAQADCFNDGNKTFCEFPYTFKFGETNFINTPEVSLIKKLKVNDNLIVKEGHTFYKGISGINYIAKTAVPIPEVFFNETIQFIEIEWLQRPEEIKIFFSTGNRGIYSALKFLYPSLMSLVFALILLVLKSEFKQDSHIFNLGIITGIIMSLYLYFNSLTPYTNFIQYSDGLLKIHILLTSLVTTSIQALTDKILKLFKKTWYWYIALITFFMILITPGWFSNNHFQQVIWTLLPTFILSTIVSIVSLYKIIKNPNYVKNRLLAPLVIVGVVSMVLSVIDTTHAVSESFSDAPISGLSLLLYYFVMMLTYFLMNKQMEISSLMINKKVAVIAKQVAHDIKSPLTALKLVSFKLKGQLTSTDYTFLQRSILRITDIINDLSFKRGNLDVNNNIQVVLLYPLIDSILSEKRLSLKNDYQFSINDNIEDQFKTIFVEIIPSDLKRSISNILNNSIEAFDEKGIIDISLIKSEGFVELRIKDNGKGIPKDLLESVLKPEATFGKSHGQGLGLSFASEVCKKFNGNIQINSELNKYTIVTIKLPIANTPIWFCQQINLSGISKIILIDDDYNLHRIWEGRFTSALGEKCPSIKSFYDPTSFMNSKIDIDDNTIVLCDYEFIGFSQTGLDVFNQIQNTHFILVTGRSEEVSLQDKIVKLGVKLLPKDLINSVNLNFIKKNYVLIDDDLLVRKTWEMQAKNKDVILQTFSNGNDFINSNLNNKNADVFIDYHLADENGVDLAIKILDLGFSNIYIASGESELELPKFIKGKILKDPPF